MATLATATEKKQMSAEEKPERKPPQRGRETARPGRAVRFSRVRFSDALPCFDQLAGPAEPPFHAARECGSIDLAAASIL